MSVGLGQFVTPDMVSSVLDRKDNTWLQLDVCPVWRETQNCPSQDLCCHAHPPPHIEILESNRVVSCYDEVKKGTCKRKDCKFFHPPNHLKNVVNTNGRNNLRLRNELKAQFKALYSQTAGTRLSSSLATVPSLPTYYNYNYPSYLPVSYVGSPTQEQDSSVSPPGDSRRSSKYHPYYTMVSGQLDRRPQTSHLQQRRVGPELASGAQLQQTLLCSPNCYDNTDWGQLLVPPGGPTTLLYSPGGWAVPTLASNSDK